MMTATVSIFLFRFRLLFDVSECTISQLLVVTAKQILATKPLWFQTVRIGVRNLILSLAVGAVFCCDKGLLN